MTFENMGELEEALRSGRLSVRSLHDIWEQRQPVPGAAAQKPTAAMSGGRQLPWIQGDLGVGASFVRHALAAQEFPLVCDASRELLRYWEHRGQDEKPDTVRIRIQYASALTRLGYTEE